MKVKIKKLADNAVIPTYATDGSAGMDLTATSKEIDNEGNIVYGTSLAFEIPRGYVGLVFPRSSNAKKALILTNSVGVIDSDYRGEVTLKFKPFLSSFGGMSFHNPAKYYEVGDRVGQIVIVPYPAIEFEEAEELTETQRGEGGYGSSGK